MREGVVIVWCVEDRTCTKTVCQEDSTLLEKGLEAVASSSCQLSKTLWTFVELSDLLPGDPEKIDLYTPRQRSLEKGEQKPCEEEHNFKTAMAMVCKARSLQRKLKSVKTDLCFMLGLFYFSSIFEVRLQLAALLAEKAWLTQENANYVRENQYLHQLVEYHQLTLQDVAI
eukprot:Gb_38222 [translate_table: standard]